MSLSLAPILLCEWCMTDWVDKFALCLRVYRLQYKLEAETRIPETEKMKKTSSKLSDFSLLASLMDPLPEVAMPAVCCFWTP